MIVIFFSPICTTKIFIIKKRNNQIMGQQTIFFMIIPNYYKMYETMVTKYFVFIEFTTKCRTTRIQIRNNGLK